MTFKNKVSILVKDKELQERGKKLLLSACWPVAGLSLGMDALVKYHDHNNMYIPLVVAGGVVFGVSISKFNRSLNEFEERVKYLLRT